MRAAGLSDVGKVRPANEDGLSVLPEQGLYVVADGMGSHNAGALAAKIVVEALPQMIGQRLGAGTNHASEDVSPLLRDTITSLSQRVWKESASRPDLRGMGATVLVAAVHADRVFIAHMGDSRAYLLREGEFRKLTQDHSVIAILLREGEITPQEARRHPARGRVSRFVGMEAEVDPDVQSLAIAAGDRLLLCTDGLTGMVADREIGAILRECADPERACRALIEVANAAGGKDNITAVVVDWGRE